MAKILPATCENGVVKVGALVIDDAVILGAGVASSEGLLILDGDDPPYYLVSNALDLKTTLEKISGLLSDLTDALTKTGETFTAVAAGMAGPSTAPPPTLPGNVTQIMAKVASLTAIKGEVDQLKEGLT